MILFIYVWLNNGTYHALSGMSIQRSGDVEKHFRSVVFEGDYSLGGIINLINRINLISLIKFNCQGFSLEIWISIFVHRQLGSSRQSPTRMFQRQSITATLSFLTMALIMRGTAYSSVISIGYS